LKQPRVLDGIPACDICVTFGRYDGVVDFEARHEKRVLNSALEIEFATDCITETLGAVPVKELYKGKNERVLPRGTTQGIHTMILTCLE
jgi:uncharacterized protein with GYD domain